MPPTILPNDPAKRLHTLFPEYLLAWVSLHKRPLPWRKDYQPYHTWIAEIMLQQTQMERGVEYFLRWCERFPSIASVAEAPEEALLKAWEGLGYYTRVRNIHAAAKQIMEKHHGVFPNRLEDIRALPGIGPYTAGAIASTAFCQDVSCVDGNVERVLARIFDIDSPVKAQPAKNTIAKLAQSLLPIGQAREFNQGMMEFGALVCRKRPLCFDNAKDCPMYTFCESHRLGIVQERPVLGKPTQIIPIDVATGILFHEGRVFIQKRLDESIWANLWEFPGGSVEAGETPEDCIVREWQEELGLHVRVKEYITMIRHGYTRYRVSLYAYLLELVPGQSSEPPELNAASAYAWIAPEDIGLYPLPAAHRKLADMYSLFTESKAT